MNPRSIHRLADETVATDALVIGSGVAGLSAALALLPRSVTVLTKTDLGGGSSRWAQGGVAAALDAGDSAALHSHDTLAAAAGLGVRRVVEVLTAEGPERVRQLIERGARFDRDQAGELLLGREGAHSRRRILHADGDATGAEMVRTLAAEVRRHPGIALHEQAFALDLVLDQDRVVGVLARHGNGRRVFHRGAAVVLATGGFGQLYARTTNPVEATGDGLAMAARAGARLVDLEFVQFHPTALRARRDPLPLVTEALRGEGARLIDGHGVRFMLEQDPRAELAPRDIVARAIRRRQKAGHRIFLDATGAVGDAFPERFPTVWGQCRHHGLDPRREPIPVTPAAHYAMAGVDVDLWGRTSLPGLWACGEVTSTGVHGANRLASNSLLEALVFGARVAEDIVSVPALRPMPAALRSEVVWREPGGSAARARPEARERIRRWMWDEVGLEREAAGLSKTLDELARLARQLGGQPSETRNLLTLGRLVAAAALAREESRGSHHRTDFARPRSNLRHRFAWTYAPEATDFPLIPADPAARPAQVMA